MLAQGLSAGQAGSVKTAGKRFWLPVLLGWLVGGGSPRVWAWDHEAAAAIRSQTLDAAVGTALPGYLCTNVAVGGRSLWFYYAVPAAAAGKSARSIEIQIRFDDGEPVVPLGNDWAGTAGMIGPTPNLAGDEAVAYSGALLQPPTNGCWIRSRVGDRRFFLRDGDAPFSALTALAQSLASALPTLPRPASFELEEGEKERANPEYLRLDRAMFARVTPGLRENPPRLDGFLRTGLPSINEGSLGFGYRLEGLGIAGGYTSLGATVLWKDGTMEAMRITSHYPRPPAPAKTYRELFQPIFGDADSPPEGPPPRFWGDEQAIQPLSASLFHAALPGTSEMAGRTDYVVIKSLMDPFAVAAYQRAKAGELGRKFSRLGTRACLYLLKSKDPLTRLLAVGQLRRVPSDWQVNAPELARDFERVYDSVPQIATVDGCIMSSKKSREIVDDFIVRANAER